MDLINCDLPVSAFNTPKSHETEIHNPVFDTGWRHACTKSNRMERKCSTETFGLSIANNADWRCVDLQFAFIGLF